MAIARTAMVDDDGTGTTGTIVNAAWKTEIYNQIDGMTHPHLGVDQVDITTTGTINDHNPGGVTVRCNNASALTVTGRVPFFDGEIAIYENVGSSTLFFSHQAAGSSAANRFILPATGGQWIGAGGAIGFKYDGTSDRWRVLFITPGAPITPTFAGGDYTHATGGGTWTVDAGDITECTFQQMGKKLEVSLRVDTTSVGGTAGTLLRRLVPGGMTATYSSSNACRITDNGAATNGFWSASTTGIFFGRSDGANWSNAAVNTTAIFASGMRIEVN